MTGFCPAALVTVCGEIALPLQVRGRAAESNGRGDILQEFFVIVKEEKLFFLMGPPRLAPK